MNSIFNPDNAFMRFLGRVGDLIIANALFIVCCIPVITAGASAAALQKVCQCIVYDEDTPLLKGFFGAFKENFKQATIAWLVILVFLVCMGANLLLIAALFTGNTAMVLRSVVYVLTAVILGISCHLFPLMVRYSNSLREHAQNAMILAVIKLPRTIAMVALTLMPLLVAFFSMEVMVSTMVFWVVIGFGFSSYMCATLMRPIFAELEKDPGKIQIMN